MIVEQATIIEAPIAIVMQVMQDVENIPAWATVPGKISNVQGSGPKMTYDWHFTVGNLHFSGRSKVLEQTPDTLITETTGDIASIWTIRLAPAGPQSTRIHVVVEYTSPNSFVELMVDRVIQQLATPEEAYENLRRFKDMVEERAKVLVIG